MPCPARHTPTIGREAIGHSASASRSGSRCRDRRRHRTPDFNLRTCTEHQMYICTCTPSTRINNTMPRTLQHTPGLGGVCNHEDSPQALCTCHATGGPSQCLRGNHVHLAFSTNIAKPKMTRQSFANVRISPHHPEIIADSLLGDRPGLKFVDYQVIPLP